MNSSASHNLTNTKMPHIDQCTTGYRERFRFTGKERDEETGYGYFGARYMDHELMTMWLSVDPMANKYPSISPYAYCAWNPVKLVDPDGREIYLGQYSDSKTRKYRPNGKENRAGTIAWILDKIYNGSKAGKYVINALIKSQKKYYISEAANPNDSDCPNYTNANGHRQIYLNKGVYGLNEAILSHELFHAFQHENNQWDKARSCEVEAFVFEGIVMSQMHGGNIPLDKMPPSFIGAISGVDKSVKSERYRNAMESLIKGFSQKNMTAAVSLFRNFSIEGLLYGDERGYKYCIGAAKSYSGSSSLLNHYKNQLY